MKKTKTLDKIILTVLCAVVVVCSVLFLRLQFQEGKAETELKIEGEIQSSYNIGDTFNIPSAVITFNGKEYDAENILFLPNGNATRTQSYTFESEGQYRLEYRAVIDAKVVSEEKTFTVNGTSYSVGNGKSSAVFGTHPQHSTLNGLCVDLVKGDTFRYNKVIDLKEKTGSDRLLDLIIVPNTAGSEDARRLNITLTDVYDPANSVTIALKKEVSTSNARHDRSWVSAGADGVQPSIGLEPNANGKLEYEGRKYNIQSNNNSGVPVNVSFTGQEYKNNEVVDFPIGTEIYGISLDYSTRKVYAWNERTKAFFLVADLDEPLIFGDKLWNGFTTGEVFLSINADEYVNTKMSFVLQDINGDNLQNNVFVGSAETTIEIENNGLAECPQAIVGKTYPVFKASAYNIYEGELPVTARVFFGYGTGAEFEVDIVNSRFETRYEGEYTIEYSAKDKYNRKAVVTYVVQAVSSGTSLNVELVEKPTDTFNVGDAVKVAKPNISTDYAKYGIECMIEAVLTSDESIRYAIDEKDLIFTPVYAGNYKIVYTITDFIETISTSYEQEIGKDGSAMFNGSVVAPKYFIKNSIVALENVYGYVFDNGKPIDAVAEIVVEEYAQKQGAPDNTVQVEDKYTVGNCQFVKVVYQLGEKKVTSDFIPVIDVNYGAALDMAKYFVVTEGSFDMAKDNESIAFRTDAGKSLDGKSYADFINVLLAGKFAFTFSPFEADGQILNHFAKFNVLLSDYKNPEVVLKFSYEKSDNKTLFYVNDEKRAELNLTFDAAVGSFILNYNNTTATVTPQVDTEIVITKDLSGKAFSGFESGRVNLTFGFDGVDGDCGIKVQKICNQQMSSRTFDLIEPLIDSNVVEGSYAVGDKIIIKKTYAADVLDPALSFKMKVKAPDGSVVSADDGTVLDDTCDPMRDYTITIAQYGQYIVEYIVQDTNMNLMPYSYAIQVPDKIGPNVVLQNKVTSGKVGQEVKLAKAIVNDNVSVESEIVILISIYYPNGKIAQTMQDGFTPDKAGVYTIYYYAKDAVGNATIVSYKVVVS